MRGCAFDRVLPAAGVAFVSVVVFWIASGMSTAFLIAALAALACAAVIVWLKPRLVVVALIGYAILTPFDTTLNTSSGGTVTKYVGLLVVLLSLVEFIRRNQVVKPDKALAAWGVYLCWATMSTLWAINDSESSGFLTTLLELFSVYAIVSLLPFTLKEVKAVLGGAVAGGAAVSCLVLYTSLHGSVGSTIRIFNGERRTLLQLPGGVADPNHTAAALLLPIALAVAFTIGARSRIQQVLASIALFMLFAGFYEIDSRGAVIALAVIAVYFVARSPRRWICAAGAAVLAAAVTLTSNPIINRFLNDSSQGNGRGSIWNVALPALKEHWLFGVGIANFDVAYDAAFLHTSQLTFNQWHRPAHSIVFSTAVELGVIGAILLAAATVAQFTALRLVPRAQSDVDLRTALEATMLGIATAALFVDLVNFKYVWLALVAVSMTRSTAIARFEPHTKVSSAHPHWTLHPWWRHRSRDAKLRVRA